MLKGKRDVLENEKFKIQKQNCFSIDMYLITHTLKGKTDVWDDDNVAARTNCCNKSLIKVQLLQLI